MPVVSPNQPMPTMSQAAIEQCLKEFEKGYMEFFSQLAPHHREFVRDLVQSYMSGDTALLDSLYAVDYDHKRVSPEVFFTHDDYLGHFKDEIFDAWWPHILNICNPANRIFEVVLTGSFGLGKTTIGTGCLMAYYLHKLLCLRDPAKFFGLGKKSKIVLGIYSLSLESAEDAGFFVLRDQILAESPFFNEVYRRSPYGEEEITFPKQIVVKTGSKSLHAAGKNLFVCAIDEMNLMAQGESTLNKAFKMANAVSRRLESRFLQRGGDIPGACIFLGSAASESSFLEQRIRRVQGKPGYYVVRGALWDFVNKDSDGNDKYCGDKFRVQVGNKESDSKVLDVVTKDSTGQWKAIPEAEPDLDCQIVMVPVEHYEAFEVDTEGALQDLAGVSIKAAMKLFPSTERVLSCTNKEIVNPFRASIIAAYLNSGVELADELMREMICRVVSGHYSPKRHPEAPRYLHVDLAKNNDRAGIVMVHPASHIIAIDNKNEDKDGLGLYDVHKTVEVDFALAITGGPKKESIDFANIRRLIFLLRRLGFWIRKVTYDSWQSEDSIQRLTDAGVFAEVKSVDTDHYPYMILRNIVTARRISLPGNNQLLVDEMTELLFDALTLKVDHPPGGTKDVADGLAGASFSCLTDKIRPTELRGKQVSKKTEAYKKYLSVLQELSETLE